MKRKTLLLVVALSVGAAMLAAGAVTAAAEDDSGDLAVDVSQEDDGTPVLTVTENSTAVANASVTVAALDNDTYGGEGEYRTDENGTVTLPALDENDSAVDIEVTATSENETVTVQTTLTATAGEDEFRTFGLSVSSFVHSLQAQNDTDEPRGQFVSSFVQENNPGASMIPGHAGPPDHAGPSDTQTGPPADAGPSDNETGPPADAGPDQNETGPPEDAGPEGDTGPPADAGPGDDSDDTEETEE